MPPPAPRCPDLGFCCCFFTVPSFVFPFFPFLPFSSLFEPADCGCTREVVGAGALSAPRGGRAPLTHPQQLHDELPVLLVLVLVLLFHLLHFTLEKKNTTILGTTTFAALCSHPEPDADPNKRAPSRSSFRAIPRASPRVYSSQAARDHTEKPRTSPYAGDEPTLHVVTAQLGGSAAPCLPSGPA